jgi:glycolate oxidase FAD binding subunit
MASWHARLERELGAEALNSLRAYPGGREVPCAAPSEVEGFQALLALAREERLKVLPLGLGSKLGWSRPPRQVDLVLSTRRFCGIHSYEPADGTVSARAGTTMAALAGVVNAGGHHLTPDVPAPEHASLGGVIAAGQSGFDRLRYGPLRNALLGASVLLADGRRARSGGQLVKNVTGYDLHRLYCGSHGTLCVLLEAALRLYPLPQAFVLFEAELASRAEAFEAARRVLALPARHLAVLAHDFAGRWSLAVGLAGRPEVLDHEAELVARALPGARESQGAAARAGLASERDRLLSDGWPELELNALPGDLEGALERILAAARALALAPATLVHPGVAQAFVRLPGLTHAQAGELTRALAPLPARCAWRRLPPGVAGALDLDPFDPAGRTPAPAMALMRSLRAALDPGELFAAGRFLGGL